MTRSEDRLLRRARLQLTLLTWAAITVVLMAVGGVALFYVSREQDHDLHAALQSAVEFGPRVSSAYSDDVKVAVVTPSGTQVSPDSPAGLPVQAGIAAARVKGSDERNVTLGRTQLRVLTEVQGDRVVQAVVSREDESDERERLLSALAIAEILGLLAAVVVGWFVARRAIAPLGQAMERQRRFVADASHELRTPLTVLTTRAQMLERALRPNETETITHAEAQALVSDAKRMADVVDDLLVSASLEARPSTREDIDLVALARTSVRAMAPHAGQLGVDLAGPPEDAAPAVVPGAERPLRRVVDALVDNALGHTPKGGHVAVGVAPRGSDWVELSVADDGAGLDPAQAERLFARFARGASDTQVDGSKRRFGLGLALVREVVEAHRGRVEVEGAPGHGATFRVLLPRA
ncbi:MAG TPA: HAMP domain-containing sensor histidine kinase [Actinomycetes bacterium]|nr:HAMP domain-containing sensor histidine kinase [Actinomycetes bacterium]